jgi:hypothetical protein
VLPEDDSPTNDGKELRDLGYFAIEPSVACAVDFAHAAGAERRNDQVQAELGA